MSTSSCVRGCRLRCSVNHWPWRELLLPTTASWQHDGREILSATTMYGPHRDDFRFLVNDRDLRLFGSRGQQRSAALALKLAEVRAMTDATGSTPAPLGRRDE